MEDHNCLSSINGGSRVLRKTAREWHERCTQLGQSSLAVSGGVNVGLNNINDKTCVVLLMRMSRKATAYQHTLVIERKLLCT